MVETKFQRDRRWWQLRRRVAQPGRFRVHLVDMTDDSIGVGKDREMEVGATVINISVVAAVDMASRVLKKER